MAVLTVYPDAGSGGASFDAGYQGDGSSWANARNATNANWVYNNLTQFLCVQTYQDLSDSTNNRIGRSIFTFDTSVGGTNPLDGTTINSAVLSVYGVVKAGACDPDVVVVEVNPLYDNNSDVSDYGAFGATDCSNVITHANFVQSGFNDFTLNAAGRALINVTGVTALGLRNKNYDIANSAPPGSESAPGTRNDILFADETGTTSDPKLVIDYTIPTASGGVMMVEGDD